MDEPRRQRAIRQFGAAGETVLEMGANLGYVSLSPSLAQRVGPQGRVIAFEPISRNLAAVRNNLASNGLSNVRRLECPASDHAGQAVIRLVQNPSTASLVRHSDDPGATELPCAPSAFDDLVDAGPFRVPGSSKSTWKALRLSWLPAEP